MEEFVRKQITEDLVEVGVIRLGVEFERPDMFEILPECARQAMTKNLTIHFLFSENAIHLLCITLYPLPRKRTTDQLKENDTEGIHIVTTSMSDPIVDMQTRITSSPHQRVPTRFCGVSTRLGVTVPLSQTQVSKIDLPIIYFTANEYALGSDVTVNIEFGVEGFDERNELICK